MLRLKFFLFTVFVSFYSLSTPLIGSETPEKNIDSFSIESSKEFFHLFRYDQSKSKEENDSSRQQLLLEFSQTLPVYFAENDLESAVKIFFDDAIQQESSKYSFINAADAAVGGNSKDIVYLIKDNAGQLCFIIKVFEKPFELKGKFLPELCGLDFLVDLQVPGTIPILPLSVGIADYQGSSYGLLLEKAASGQRVDQYLLQLAAQPLGSEERKTRFEKTKKIVEQVAEALAQLHSTKSEGSGKIPANDLKDWDKRIKRVSESPFIVSEIAQKVDWEVFLNYLESVKQQALEIPVFYTYLHGSTHFGNVFYDEAADVVQLIDVGSLTDSFDREGKPMRCEFVDLLRSERDIKKKGLSILSQEEVNLLIQAYYEAYERAAGALDERVFEFFKTSEKLRCLYSYAFQDELDPEKKKRDEVLFYNNLNYLVERAMGQ
jgi:Ser/Thr protein kinase RdoA (MazF antagonist)